MEEIRSPWRGASAYTYEEIDSTNLEILRRAKTGAPEGTVVTSEEQLEGRGRRGRSWESPTGVSIYMSVLLRPRLPMEKAHILTPVSALAVCEVLREQDIEAYIKWPNDVVINGGKVCGILSELQFDIESKSGKESNSDGGSRLDSQPPTREEKKPGNYCVVTGIGLNVNNRSFGNTAGAHGTSLYLETGWEFNREELAQNILEKYRAYYEQVNEAGSLLPIQEAYERLLINCNREVRILSPSENWQGIARGINSMGELLVERNSTCSREGDLPDLSQDHFSVEIEPCWKEEEVSEKSKQKESIGFSYPKESEKNGYSDEKPFITPRLIAVSAGEVSVRGVYGYTI